MFDLATGERLYQLCKFSEIFPDWDLPKIPAMKTSSIEQATTSQERGIFETVVYDKLTYLPVATSSTAPAFLTRYLSDIYTSNVKACATSLVSVSAYNIGISVSGTMKAMATGLPAGQGIEAPNISRLDQYSVHGSTFNNASYAQIKVTEVPIIYI